MKIKAVSRVSKENESLVKECLCDDLITYEEIKERVKEVRPVMPPFFLCMESDQIIGCLCLYEVGEEDCYGQIFLAEHTPQSVENMIVCLKEELSDYGFLRLYLSPDQPSNESLTPYIQTESTEYVMKADKISPDMTAGGLALAKKKGLVLTEYHAKTDREFYLKLLANVFDMGSNESLTRVEELESVKNMTAYVLKSPDGMPVGMAGCYVQASAITIFDVAVEKKQQGSGYGKAMLSLLFERLLKEEKTFLLQVSSDSAAACHLYREFGFTVTDQLQNQMISLLQP